MLPPLPEQRPSLDPRMVWLRDPQVLPCLLLEARATGWRLLAVAAQPDGWLIQLTR